MNLGWILLKLTISLQIRPVSARSAYARPGRFEQEYLNEHIWELPI